MRKAKESHILRSKVIEKQSLSEKAYCIAPIDQQCSPKVKNFSTKSDITIDLLECQNSNLSRSAEKLEKSSDSSVDQNPSSLMSISTSDLPNKNNSGVTVSSTLPPSSALQFNEQTSALSFCDSELALTNQVSVESSGSCHITMEDSEIYVSDSSNDAQGEKLKSKQVISLPTKSPCSVLNPPPHILREKSKESNMTENNITTKELSAGTTMPNQQKSNIFQSLPVSIHSSKSKKSQHALSESFSCPSETHQTLSTVQRVNKTGNHLSRLSNALKTNPQVTKNTLIDNSNYSAISFKGNPQNSLDINETLVPETQPIHSPEFYVGKGLWYNQNNEDEGNRGLKCEMCKQGTHMCLANSTEMHRKQKQDCDVLHVCKKELKQNKENKKCVEVNSVKLHRSGIHAKTIKEDAKNSILTHYVCTEKSSQVSITKEESIKQVDKKSKGLPSLYCESQLEGMKKDELKSINNEPTNEELNRIANSENGVCMEISDKRLCEGSSKEKGNKLQSDDQIDERKSSELVLVCDTESGAVYESTSGVQKRSCSTLDHSLYAPLVKPNVPWHHMDIDEEEDIIQFNLLQAKEMLDSLTESDGKESSDGDESDDDESVGNVDIGSLLSDDSSLQGEDDMLDYSVSQGEEDVSEDSDVREGERSEDSSEESDGSDLEQDHEEEDMDITAVQCQQEEKTGMSEEQMEGTSQLFVDENVDHNKLSHIDKECKGNKMSVKEEEENSYESESQCTDEGSEYETKSFIENLQKSEGSETQGKTSISHSTKEEYKQNMSHSKEMEGSEISDGTESQCSDHSATLCEGNVQEREGSEESNEDSKSQCTNKETESKCTTDTESQCTEEDIVSQCTTEERESLCTDDTKSQSTDEDTYQNTAKCTNEDSDSQCTTEDRESKSTDDVKLQSTDEDTDQNTTKCTNEDTESQCTTEDTESESTDEDTDRNTTKCMNKDSESHCTTEETVLECTDDTKSQITDEDTDHNTTVTSCYKNSRRMKGSEDPGEVSEDMISLCDRDDGLFDTEDTAGSNEEQVKDKQEAKAEGRMDVLSHCGDNEERGCNSLSSEFLEMNTPVEDKVAKSLSEEEMCEKEKEDRKCRDEPEVISLLSEDDDSTQGSTFKDHEVHNGKLQKDGVASSNTVQMSVMKVISLAMQDKDSKYVTARKVEDVRKIEKSNTESQSSDVEVISLLTDDEDSNHSAASTGKGEEIEKFQEEDLVANTKLRNSADEEKKGEDDKITTCNAANSATQETIGSSMSNSLVTAGHCDSSTKQQREDKSEESSDTEVVAILEAQEKLELTGTHLKGSTSSLVCRENSSSGTPNESGTKMESNETYLSESKSNAEIVDQNIKEMEPTGENNISEQTDSAFKLKPDLQNDTELSGGDKSAATKNTSEIESQISSFLSSVKKEGMKSVEEKAEVKQEVDETVTSDTVPNKAQLMKTKKVVQIKNVKCSPSTPTKSKCEKISVIQNPISTRITTWQRDNVPMSEGSASQGQYRNSARPHWCKDLREKLNTRNRMMYQNRARGKFQNYFASLRGQSWRYGTSAWGRNWRQKFGKAEWDLEVPDEIDRSLELDCEGNDLLHEFDTHGRDYVQLNHENKEDSRRKQDYSDLEPSENYVKGKEEECSQYSSNKEFGTPCDRKYDLTCHKKFDFDLSCSNRRQDHSRDLKDKGDVSTLENDSTKNSSNRVGLKVSIHNDIFRNQHKDNLTYRNITDALQKATTSVDHEAEKKIIRSECSPERFSRSPYTERSPGKKGWCRNCSHCQYKKESMDSRKRHRDCDISDTHQKRSKTVERRDVSFREDDEVLRHENDSAKYENESNKYDDRSDRFRNEYNRYESGSDRNESTMYDDRSERYGNDTITYENRTDRFRIESIIHDDRSDRYRNEATTYEDRSDRYRNESITYENRSERYKNESNSYEDRSDRYRNESAIYDDRFDRLGNEISTSDDRYPDETVRDEYRYDRYGNCSIRYRSDPRSDRYEIELDRYEDGVSRYAYDDECVSYKDEPLGYDESVRNDDEMFLREDERSRYEDESCNYDVRRHEVKSEHECLYEDREYNGDDRYDSRNYIEKHREDAHVVRDEEEFPEIYDRDEYHTDRNGQRRWPESHYDEPRIWDVLEDHNHTVKENYLEQSPRYYHENRNENRANRHDYDSDNCDWKYEREYDRKCSFDDVYGDRCSRSNSRERSDLWKCEQDSVQYSRDICDHQTVSYHDHESAVLDSERSDEELKYYEGIPYFKQIVLSVVILVSIAILLIILQTLVPIQFCAIFKA